MVGILFFTRPTNSTRAQYKISRLKFRGLSRLIKWIELWLTYIALYIPWPTYYIRDDTIFDMIHKPDTKLTN
jgi:hypothetical protein